MYILVRRYLKLRYKNVEPTNFIARYDLSRDQSIICLTHWGRVTHICVGNLTTYGPDNLLSPGQHQAIIWTNPGILLIGPLGTNFSEILIEIPTYSFKKMHLKMSSGKWRLSCLGLNVFKRISRHVRRCVVIRRCIASVVCKIGGTKLSLSLQAAALVFISLAPVI